MEGFLLATAASHLNCRDLHPLVCLLPTLVPFADMVPPADSMASRRVEGVPSSPSSRSGSSWGTPSSGMWRSWGMQRIQFCDTRRHTKFSSVPNTDQRWPTSLPGGGYMESGPWAAPWWAIRDPWEPACRAGAQWRGQDPRKGLECLPQFPG